MYIRVCMGFGMNAFVFASVRLYVWVCVYGFRCECLDVCLWM